MSEFFNAPYATANRTILRSALRNRKLADQLIKQIHDLQLYVAAHAGTITKWVMPSDIVPSTDSPFIIDSTKIRSQMTMALNSEYLASFMLNVIRELQIQASIAPIMNSYVTYKKSPFNTTLQKLMIATLANRKLGKLLQEAILELQVQIEALGAPTPAVAASFTGDNGGDLATPVTIDAVTPGAAGNLTIVANSTDTIAALILAQHAGLLVVSVGDDTQIPTADIVLAGGVDAIPFALSQPRFV